MCGRFTLSTPTEILAELFALDGETESLPPRYNIAPTQPVAVVRTLGPATGGGGSRSEASPSRSSPPAGTGGAAGSTERGDRASNRDTGGAPPMPYDGPLSRRLDLLRWGLIPFWAKDPGIGARMINARAETVAEKPAFRAAFRRRRCLIPADGFYEWRREGPRKQPYHFRLPDGGPFAMAGLWERWSPEGADPIETCTILTTDANDVVRPVHHRMPVILLPEAYETWLDPDVDDRGALAPLLVPLAGDAIVGHAVSTHVNAPVNDDPTCVDPLR